MAAAMSLTPVKWIPQNVAIARQPAAARGRLATPQVLRGVLSATTSRRVTDARPGWSRWPMYDLVLLLASEVAGAQDRSFEGLPATQLQSSAGRLSDL